MRSMGKTPIFTSVWNSLWCRWRRGRGSNSHVPSQNHPLSKRGPTPALGWPLRRVRWSGRQESNLHSLRRRIYSPVGSPPAQLPDVDDGGPRGTRTRTSKGHRILRPARLPVPPQGHSGWLPPRCQRHRDRGSHPRGIYGARLCFEAHVTNPYSHCQRCKGICVGNATASESLGL